MTPNKRRIIDADGHVAEDAQAIVTHMPEAYREKARAQPFYPFPPFDHLHAAHLVDMPAGAFNRKVGPKEWLAFLDEVGLESTVLYPTAGVGSSNIVNPDWAIDVARAYNDWLHETYLQHSARFRGLALLPQPVLNAKSGGRRARPRGRQPRHVRSGAAVEQSACAAARRKLGFQSGCGLSKRHSTVVGRSVLAAAGTAASENVAAPRCSSRCSGMSAVRTVCVGDREHPIVETTRITDADTAPARLTGCTPAIAAARVARA